MSCIELDCLLVKALLLAEDLVELCSSDEGHDEIQTHIILEQVIHTAEEDVIALKHDIFLEHSAVDLVVLDENILTKTFDRIELIFSLQLSQKDFAEGTSSNDH